MTLHISQLSLYFAHAHCPTQVQPPIQKEKKKKNRKNRKRRMATMWRKVIFFLVDFESDVALPFISYPIYCAQIEFPPVSGSQICYEKTSMHKNWPHDATNPIIGRINCVYALYLYLYQCLDDFGMQMCVCHSSIKQITFMRCDSHEYSKRNKL